MKTEVPPQPEPPSSPRPPLLLLCPASGLSAQEKMTTRKGKTTAAAEEGLDTKSLPNIRSPGEGGEDEAARAPPRAGDLLGKHRLSAAISRLHQEIESLQGELEELDTLGPSSKSCEEVFLGVESISDGLIPTSMKCHADIDDWDRWFQPVRGSHRRSRSSSSHRWWTRRVSEFS